MQTKKLTRLLNTNSVVRIRILRMEVEDPQQARPLKDQDLICFILQADICLCRMQPAVLLFRPLYLTVELVQELIPEQIVVREIELSPGVPE